MVLRSLIGIAALTVGSPAVAQMRQNQGSARATDADADADADQPFVSQQQSQTPSAANQVGSTARSSVGQVGQRQSRDTAADDAGIKPMARIASRIQNRVQNRIRNRIDRDYDPQANAAAPFAVAEDQSRRSGRPR